METGQTCRVTPNPLSHPLATQKGSHLGVPAIPSLHQAGRRCCWHWSKKAPSPPCLPCSPSCCSPKSLNREKPKPQISPPLFPGSLEGTAKEEGRRKAGQGTPAKGQLNTWESSLWLPPPSRAAPRPILVTESSFLSSHPCLAHAGETTPELEHR